MARDPDRPGRFSQIGQVLRFTRERDPKLLQIVLLPALAILGIGIGVGFAIAHPVYLGVLGLLGAFFWMTSTFGRRSMAAQYDSVEGQAGAAAAVLQGMRGAWTVQPAVAVTRNQDLVHRALGRPGVVLVGEGSPARLKELLVAERKRVLRVAPETPVYEIVVGNDDGQVPLRKLNNHVMRLPRNLKGAQVQELANRLRALGASSLPIPKGPLPRNVRPPRGMR